MSYWTFSDLFEEPGPPTAPFQGGFGLLNPQGIRKPAYFAYEYLERLGGREVDTRDPQSIATLQEGGVNVLAWHYAPLDQPVSNRSYFTKVQPVADLAPLEIVLSSMPPGPHEVRIYRVGFERNDAYTAYLKLGSPATLSAAQMDELQALVRDEPERQSLTIGADRAAQLSVPLREYDVVLIDLRRQTEP
jgi:xylan 1,4-beta-xylosidase